MSDPAFKPAIGGTVTVEMFEGESHRSVCHNAQAMAATGNRRIRNDFTEASLAAR